MENAPVISLIARSFMPQEEDKHNDYYEKWFFEAYIPFLGSTGGFNAAERYRILKDNADYPKYIQIWHFNNLKDYQIFERAPEFIAILNAMDANFPGTDFRWWVQYYVINSWSREKQPESQRAETGGVIHIESSNSSEKDEEKYFPSIVDSESANGIVQCRIVKDNPKYPTGLTIFSFDDLKQLTEWEKKREAASISKEAVPDTAKAKVWYVQYELTRSWKK